MTQFTKLYERFKNKIEDYDLAQMTERDADAMCYEYLMSAIDEIINNDIITKSDLTKLEPLNPDDPDNDSYIAFTDTLESYEEKGIVYYMLAAWYEPKVNSLENTILFLGTKDEKWSSQKDHWEQTLKMRDSYISKGRKFFRNHSIRSNSYLDDES